jgi:hypothetical protein
MEKKDKKKRTNNQTNKQPNKQTNNQTNNQTNKQTNKQTNRQTNSTDEQRRLLQARATVNLHAVVLHQVLHDAALVGVACQMKGRP